MERERERGSTSEEREGEQEQGVTKSYCLCTKIIIPGPVLAS